MQPEWKIGLQVIMGNERENGLCGYLLYDQIK